MKIRDGALKFDRDGLIPAVVQDVTSGQVLMVAHMNQGSLDLTLKTGRTWFWSRSRSQLWPKGETSGHIQRVIEVRVDCDGDCLLFLVEQTGSACHEGDFSCFHYRLPGLPGDAPAPEDAATGTPRDTRILTPRNAINRSPGNAGRVLAELEAILRDRMRNPEPGSYTAGLFAAGKDAILKKVGEEAVEVILASKNGDRANLIHEVADLWFHSLVALAEAGLGLDDVMSELESRRGKRRGSSPR